MGASPNQRHGMSWIEWILIIILIIIIVMIVWALFGPSFLQWLSEFWAQINQPNP